MNKRIKDSTAGNLETLKSSIKEKLIQYLVSSPEMYRKTLLNGIVFIAHNDYPHNFSQLTQYFEQML